MNSKRVTLVVVLFMGYFTSEFLSFVSPIGAVAEVFWSAIMLEYLGYSVFLFYVVYMIPTVLETYFGIQPIINYFFPSVLISDSPFFLERCIAVYFLLHTILAVSIHMVLKWRRCFRSFIP